MSRRLIASLIVLSALGCCWAGAGEPQTPLFPFVLPWDDATPGVANISSWLHKPAGRFGHVTVSADGRLSAGGQRIRFFGVDLSFSANLPRKEDAVKVAARMAKFGINIVRFHIMDSRRFPDGLLARDGVSTRDLDPEALDRLDYFTSELNRNGICVYLCLLNYRRFNAADGLPAEIERLGGTVQRQHVVGFFYEPLMDLQKEYARKLLTHRNAYTGMTYAGSPGVAFVEINNENGLIHAWLGQEVDPLPEVFLSVLRRQWNDWLRFLWDTEDRYWQTMYRYLKDELGVKALVIGTVFGGRRARPHHLAPAREGGSSLGARRTRPMQDPAVHPSRRPEPRRGRHRASESDALVRGHGGIELESQRRRPSLDSRTEWAHTSPRPLRNRFASMRQPVY